MPKEYARDWIIAKKSAGIFLDLGMGKTVCTLTALQELMHDCFDAQRVLVIAPLRVAMDVWSREKDKWDHLKYMRISKVIGTARERKAALDERADIYVINRENVVWLVDYLGNNWCFDMVVIDELSSFKSPGSKRFKALRQVRPYIKRIAGLTGTPAPNGLMDLWSQIYLLDGGARLGRTLKAYRRKYFEPLKSKGNFIFSWRLRKGVESEIYDRIKDICMSMKTADYLSLPLKWNNNIMVELPKCAMKKYLEFEERMQLDFENCRITAGSAGALASKLLQAANGAVYDEKGDMHVLHDAKLEALDDMVERAKGRPILIFYNFRHDLKRISEHLKNREFRVLSTADDMDDWNCGKIPIMLAHPAAAGHGLNLQSGGSAILWFGLTWSLELYQQANARLYRQGQRDYVIINHIIARGTIDEDVMKVLQMKGARQNHLLEAVKARLKRKNSWRVK